MACTTAHASKQAHRASARRNAETTSQAVWHVPAETLRQPFRQSGSGLHKCERLTLAGPDRRGAAVRSLKAGAFNARMRVTCFIGDRLREVRLACKSRS